MLIDLQWRSMIVYVANVSVSCRYLNSNMQFTNERRQQLTFLIGTHSYSRRCVTRHVKIGFLQNQGINCYFHPSLIRSAAAVVTGGKGGATNNVKHTLSSATMRGWCERKLMTRRFAYPPNKIGHVNKVDYILSLKTKLHVSEMKQKISFDLFWPQVLLH